MLLGYESNSVVIREILAWSLLSFNESNLKFKTVAPKPGQKVL